MESVWDESVWDGIGLGCSRSGMESVWDGVSLKCYRTEMESV